MKYPTRKHFIVGFLAIFVLFSGVGAAVGSYSEDWDDQSLDGYTVFHTDESDSSVSFVTRDGGSALQVEVSGSSDVNVTTNDTYSIGNTGVQNTTLDFSADFVADDLSQWTGIRLWDTSVANKGNSIVLRYHATDANHKFEVTGGNVEAAETFEIDSSVDIIDGREIEWIDLTLSIDHDNDRVYLYGNDGGEYINTSLTQDWNDPDSIKVVYRTSSTQDNSLTGRYDNINVDSGGVEGVSGTVTNNQTGEPINNTDVEVFDVSMESLVQSTTTDSNGDYELTVNDGSYYIRYKKDGLYYRNITYTTVPPGRTIDVQLDPVATSYFNATPRGGEYVQNRSTSAFNISIETREPDGQDSQVTSRFMWFNETSGAWEEFKSISWNTDGGTKVTHDFESPHDWNAGANRWFVNTTTSRGNFHSSNYTFISPGNITLVDASDTSIVITTDTFDVTLSSLDSSFQKTISTSDGKVDLNDIPREDYDVRITQTSGPNDWRDRNLIIDDTDISALWTVALVNNTEFGLENQWYSQEFELVDETGQWPPRNVYLLLEQRVDGDFEVVTGDLFGVQNSVVLDVNDSEDYRMTLLHAVRGDTRHMGTFTGNSTASDEVVTITVTGTVGNPDEDDLEGYHIDAYIDGNRDPTVTPFLRFEYNDPEELTTNLEFTVYEKGNESHILQNLTNVSFDQLGKTTFTQTVTNQEANNTWVVDWSGTRNGTAISGKIIVGGDQLDPGVDMPDTWMHWGATIFIILIGALFGGSVNARLGVIVTPMVAGIFYVTGWLPQSYTIGIVIFTLILGGMVLVANHQLGD